MITGKSRIHALLMGLVLTFPAAAQGVTPITDNRVVYRYFDGGNSQTYPDSPFADFDVAYQNTTVSPSLFQGNGSGYGESDFTFFIAESVFDVTFEVMTPVLLALDGSFAANSGDFGYAQVDVKLYQLGSGSPQLVYGDSLFSDFEPADGLFAFDGSLATGQYRLLLDTSITPGGYDTTGDFSFTATFSELPDTDGDGVTDADDNCTETANADQTDGDGDGYGNRCDADLSNDCQINATDLGFMKALFFSSDDTADLNADGSVNAIDLGIMKAAFFGRPGPSGLSSACSTD